MSTRSGPALDQLSKERSENEGNGIKGSKTEGVVEPPPAPLVDSKETREWSFYRAIIAEFMATLLFLYISLTTLVGTTRTGAGSVGLIETAWAFGGMIFILVYCIAGISGGHINPAVTFGLFVAKKVTLTRALAYIVAQCLGAICGALIARGVQGNDEFHTFGQGSVNYVRSGHSIGEALGAEIMGTFVLLYTVLCATDPTRSARDSHVPVLAPLPIGFAVFVIHLATIPITGTSINPARSLGAAVANPQHGRWSQHWIFWVGPLAGAACASLYHVYVLKASAFRFRSLYE